MAPQTVEFDLAQVLDRLEQKLDRFIETTPKDLTDLKVKSVA